MTASNEHDSPRNREARAADGTALLVSLFALILAAGAIVVAAVGSTGSSAPAASAAGTVAAKTAPAKTVTVAMHDPGCHWFQVGSSHQKSLSLSGPVNLRNLDEAAVEVAGNGTTVTDQVGSQVALQPGAYTIKMVGQAPDDNTLHLQVS